MMIGRLEQDGDNLRGVMSVVGLQPTPLLLETCTSKKGEEYYKVYADPEGANCDIGAAFKKKKDNNEYLSITLDSPVFPTPIYGAIFPDMEGGGFKMVWDRPKNKDVAPQVAQQADQKNEPKAEHKTKASAKPAYKKGAKPTPGLAP